MYRAEHQLPFPMDRWDHSTLNQNLPQGNDIWPPINLPQQYPAEYVGIVVSLFRHNAQSSINKTPVHTFVYNVLSNRFFNNQDFVNWCQQAVDFAEYIHVVQGDHPQQAAEKAAKLIYWSALAVISANYPAVLQFVDQNTHNALIEAGKQYQNIVQDIGVFRQRSQGGFQNYGNFQQQQPFNQQSFNTGFQQPSMMRFNTNQQQVSHSNIGSFAVNPQGGSQPPQRNDGRYIDFNATNGNVPRNQTWSANQPEQIKPVNVPPMRHYSTQPVSEKPAPRGLQDIKIDPDYYRPAGFEVSIKRPYDVIYNPGDVEIRPAHLSNWKRTKNERNPHPICYDSQRFVLFHVKWPDGLVEEKLIEWEPTMDYLKHELNADIRLKVAPEDGVIIPADMPSSKLHNNNPSVNVFEVEPLIARTELEPVEVKGLIVSSSDLENEKTARNSVMEKLGITDPNAVPAHVYHSANVHPIEIMVPPGDEEAAKRYKKELTRLVDSGSLLAVRDVLVDFKRRGILSPRSVRFIDKRLTHAVNYAIANNLALEKLTIDSFLGDISDLYTHMDTLDPGYVKVFESQAGEFLRCWLTFAETQDDEDGSGVFALMDQTINLQTTWSSDLLITHNMKEGPVLITHDANPEMYKVIVALLNSKNKSQQLSGCLVRLISKDGVYFDVIFGWLVKDALLLKLNV